MQHLGLPTQYFDFSLDPEIAAAFAVAEKDAGRVVSIGVLDITIAVNSSQVAKLENNPYCERTRRQKAYGIAPSIDDLKSTEAKEKIGIQWMRCKVTQSDVEHFRAKFEETLDPKTDPVAGVLRNEVNGYVADMGKLRHAVANYIARKIPMVPLVAQVKSWMIVEDNRVPEDIECPPPAAHVSWNDEQERNGSLKYWSAAYPEVVLPQDYLIRMMPEIPPSGIYVVPVTHFPQI